VERVAYVHVTVEADSAQVQYGRGRAHDVSGEPQATNYVTEYPTARDVIDDGERHDGEGYERVGEGQGDHEVVARVT